MVLLDTPRICVGRPPCSQNRRTRHFLPRRFNGDERLQKSSRKLASLAAGGPGSGHADARSSSGPSRRSFAVLLDVEGRTAVDIRAHIGFEKVEQPVEADGPATIRSEVEIGPHNQILQ